VFRTSEESVIFFSYLTDYLKNASSVQIGNRSTHRILCF